MRLVGGPAPNEGTVEYIVANMPGVWQTTCGTNLGIHDAIAICDELDFAGANRAITSSPYPSTLSGPALFPSTFLNCQGEFISCSGVAVYL